MRENRVAVVICNWNKRDYVLRCVESVLHSTYSNADIYVVDNASTDGSADALEIAFGKQITVIRNGVNKGGSGGFNTGLQMVLERGYEMVFLLDNDVLVEPQAMEQSVRYMDERPDVGVVGSMIYSMDEPQVIQELGAKIDWDRFYIRPIMKGQRDHGQAPVETECDYVPACAMLVRCDAIRKAGLMDEAYFIYWDDIDWGHRLKQAGYRVVALSTSKVRHKMGVANTKNTFGTYYFWRNRIHFFASTLSAQRLPAFAETLFQEAFQAMYFSWYAGKQSVADTVLCAIQDACQLLRGRASEGRISVRELVPGLETIIQAKLQIFVTADSPDTVDKILPRLASLFPDTHFGTDVNGAVEKPFRIHLTPHISDVRNALSDEIDVYIDAYLNFVHTKGQRRILQDYETVFQFAKTFALPRLLQGLIRLQNQLQSQGENSSKEAIQ